LTPLINGHFIAERAEVYADAVHAKGAAMYNFVGFIDGTVLEIARPTGHLAQSVVNNKHKRKHA